MLPYRCRPHVHVQVRERHSRLEVPVHIVAPIVAPRIMITSAKFVFDSYTLGGPVRPPEDVAPTIRRLIDEAVRQLPAWMSPRITGDSLCVVDCVCVCVCVRVIPNVLDPTDFDLSSILDPKV